MMIEIPRHKKDYCKSCICTPEGVEETLYKAFSLEDALRYEPAQAVYTVFHTFHTTKVLQFESHVKRLKDSAMSYGVEISVDAERLREVIRAQILKTNWGDVRCRVTVPLEVPTKMIIDIEPFLSVSQTVVKQGVECVTLSDVHREKPEAKQAQWIRVRHALSKQLPAGVHTGLMLDQEGFFLEGLDCNFFAIKGGRLFTATAGVLPGISQEIVLKVADAILPVETHPVHLSDILDFEEAFISSSSRGVLPVVKIDGVQIGEGTPGPMTMGIRDVYDEWIEDHLEEL